MIIKLIILRITAEALSTGEQEQKISINQAMNLRNLAVEINTYILVNWIIVSTENGNLIREIEPQIKYIKIKYLNEAELLALDRKLIEEKKIEIYENFKKDYGKIKNEYDESESLREKQIKLQEREREIYKKWVKDNIKKSESEIKEKLEKEMKEKFEKEMKEKSEKQLRKLIIIACIVTILLVVCVSYFLTSTFKN